MKIKYRWKVLEVPVGMHQAFTIGRIQYGNYGDNPECDKDRWFTPLKGSDEKTECIEVPVEPLPRSVLQDLLRALRPTGIKCISQDIVYALCHEVARRKALRKISELNKSEADIERTERLRLREIVE